MNQIAKTVKNQWAVIQIHQKTILMKKKFIEMFLGKGGSIKMMSNTVSNMY